MNKVAIYSRLSSEDRDKSHPEEDSRSIQTQKTMLIEEALKRNWEVYNIYSDDDFSGTDAHRPGYRKLLEDAEGGKFDIVLCKSQSRFTRDMEHVEKYINGKFKEWNIRFVSILDNSDTEIRGNQKSRQINGLVNQWFVEDLSYNVQQSFIVRKGQGLYISSSYPYGYKKDPNNHNKLIIDSEAADVVRKIFRLYLQGYGVDNIAKRLDAAKILPPAEYKRQNGYPAFMPARRSSRYAPAWQAATVTRILKNEIYLGHLLQFRSKTIDYKTKKRIDLPKEEWIRCENTHRAIISEEDFKKAEDIRKRRKHFPKANKKNIFTGLLKCGQCGRSMVVSQVRNNRRYYKCNSSRTGSYCSKAMIEDGYLIDQALKELRQYADSYISAEAMAMKIKRVVSYEEDIGKIELQIEKNEGRINELNRAGATLYMDKVNGIISLNDFQGLNSTYSEEKEKLIETNQKLYEQISYIKEKMKMRTSVNEKVLEKAHEILKLDRFDRIMAEELIEVIYMTPGEWGQKILEIHWKF